VMGDGNANANGHEIWNLDGMICRNRGDDWFDSLLSQVVAALKIRFFHFR
jgi:hypothetical protein